MTARARNGRAPARSTLGVEDSASTPNLRYGALAIGATLVVVASLAMLFGRGPGPEIKPLIPLTAAIWSFADILTALLLLAPFYASGRLYFAFLVAAYGFTGCMTWPYLATFPGIFQTGALSVGDEQRSIYLWSIWHCVFPTLIIFATLNDTALRRIASRRAIRLAIGIIAAGTVTAAGFISALVFAYSDALPHFVDHGRFASTFVVIFVPSLAVLDALACIVLLRRKPLTPLALFLSLAVFSSAIDASLNLSAHGYSYAWDAGKLVTVFTGSVVLCMLLYEMAGLYARLARVVNLDVLTSLQNRRAFDKHFALVFHNARAGTL